ncbi:hypothetical protein RchiOBHm_Chr7g0203031 [Rosa chinensis]|uniref:Uncharacterized protein n=1 Tax=Rosa chinensis TaxID=74649 RepID=A0A2P6P8A8_ROSCH|nr:hypothetical protein RchiOBHm_Chr7g0203031 [Rosa chinensis]
MISGSNSNSGLGFGSEFSDFLAPQELRVIGLESDLDSDNNEFKSGGRRVAEVTRRMRRFSTTTPASPIFRLTSSSSSETFPSLSTVLS